MAGILFVPYSVKCRSRPWIVRVTLVSITVDWLGFRSDFDYQHSWKELQNTAFVSTSVSNRLIVKINKT
jgi:hypothetical protein